VDGQAPSFHSAYCQMSRPENSERKSMGFILEQMSPESLAKVLLDMQVDDPINRFTRRRGTLDSNPQKKWAINRDRDSYLFFGPSLGEAGYYNYTFFFNGKFYLLRIKAPDGDVVEFLHHYDSSILSSELRQALEEAFHAFGRLGRGKSEIFPELNISYKN
jgi:hypothetical protein